MLNMLKLFKTNLSKSVCGDKSIVKGQHIFEGTLIQIRYGSDRFNS